jgi:hypothetical protein
MRVKDIWSDLRELTGTNDEDTNYAALALGLSWLANEKLFDPFIGYIDFTVDGGYTIALPREVKTPLQINLNNNPSFHRSRLWEFAANSDGTVEGETIGWTWDNRGYARVQDERALPSKLRYVVDNPEDVGKTLTLKFLDDEGRFHYEVLTAANTPEDATESIATVHQIESVIREATLGDSYLIDGDAGTVGRYYNDEEQPEYRVIKLSKTGVAVRMMFRRHEPQTFSSQEDVIPFHSRLAIIWAAKTVRLLQGEIFDRAAMAASLAKEFAAKEQGSRDEAEEIAAATQVCGVRNSNISTLDSMIVADVYDDASEIFGPIGRAKLLDWISMARDLLAKKGQWDATVGNVDLWKPDTSEQITPHPGMKGTGIFTLPRYCGSVLNVRPNSLISYPRNGWFEFHMNGTGEGYRSAPGTWDMLGTACIISDLQRDEDTRKVIPVKLASVCFESADVGKTVRVYGLERLADGSEVEVWRSGAEGYLLTMALTPSIPATDAPNWVLQADHGHAINRPDSGNARFRDRDCRRDPFHPDPNLRDHDPLCRDDHRDRRIFPRGQNRDSGQRAGLYDRTPDRTGILHRKRAGLLRLHHDRPHDPATDRSPARDPGRDRRGLGERGNERCLSAFLRQPGIRRAGHIQHPQFREGGHFPKQL